MTNLLKEATKQLSRDLQKHASESITYKRDTDYVSLCATFTTKRFRFTDEEGIVIVHISKDFIFPVADLVLVSAGVIEPEKRDVIEYFDGVDTHEYSVYAPNNEHVFEYADRFRVQYLIHTIYEGII